jgi:siderophore synthetase component
MRDLVARDAELSRLVVVAEEHSWSGWQHPSGRDEFEDRPGHLAAQIRVYPRQMLTDPRRLVLPMAGLAAHEWDTLGEVFGRIRFGGARGRDGALDLFGELADAFCRMGLSFLRYGVLPELHGQNVLVVFLDGAVERFILRDHDALRLYPEWMAVAGVPDPAYRITPGAPQSLYLPSPEALLGYLQTLGFQVNLYGIADALTRRYEMNEAVFWSRLRASVASALAELTLPEHVAELVHRVVLGSSTWPCRQLLGPMLRRVRPGGVSMPAALGQVPNPLLSGPPAAIPRTARS